MFSSTKYNIKSCNVSSHSIINTSDHLPINITIQLNNNINLQKTTNQCQQPNDSIPHYLWIKENFQQIYIQQVQSNFKHRSFENDSNKELDWLHVMLDTCAKDSYQIYMEQVNTNKTFTPKSWWTHDLSVAKGNLSFNYNQWRDKKNS